MAFWALLAAACSWCEDSVVDSLEWMAVDAELVIRGKVVNIQEQPLEFVVIRRVTVAVEETIKGKAADEVVRFAITASKGDKTGTEWPVNDHSLLFFLKRAGEDEWRRAPWVPRDACQFFVDLVKPARVYTSDMRRPKDGEEVLKIAREYARFDAAPREPANDTEAGHSRERDASKLAYFGLDVPPGAKFFHEVWGGSSVSMRVPTHEKWRKMLLEQARSEDDLKRWNAAWVLRYYPGKETVEALTRLLDDPSTLLDPGGRDQPRRAEYVGRKCAYRSLLYLGQKPQKPMLEREPTEAELKGATR